MLSINREVKAKMFITKRGDSQDAWGMVYLFLSTLPQLQSFHDLQERWGQWEGSTTL